MLAHFKKSIQPIILPKVLVMKVTLSLITAILFSIGPAVSADTNLPVTTGLYAWYTVDSLAGLSEGASVYSWVNSADNSNFDLTSLGPYAPTYSTTGFKDGPSVHFSTNTPMGTASNIGLSGDPAFTVVFAGTITNLGNIAHPWVWGDGSGETGHPGGASDFEIQNLRVDYATGYSRDANTPNGSFSGLLGQPVIVSFARSPGPLNSTTSIIINGINQPISGSNLSPNIVDTPFHIGPTYAQYGASSPTMNVAEVIIYDRALDMPEILSIESFLTNKYTFNDTDNDGIPDEQDNCPDIENSDQADSDSDGPGDVCDVCPYDALNDGDGDGICGDVDNCPYVENFDQTDTDGDEVGDVCNDADDNDGDEWNNALDNCPDVANPGQEDGDGDTFGNVCDVCPLDALNDADGDGICESDDNCPLLANPDQKDTDEDGLGDACDPDDDDDTIADEIDNCPLNVNPDQSDIDGDGAGDVCDTDDDNDGVLDADDQCLYTPIGAIVNDTGCSVSDICPCDNAWKNHGAYVRCVAHTSEDFVEQGLITEAEKDAIVSEAAESDCGHKK